MKRLEYKIEISAPAKKVWNKMLQPDSYKEWAQASWPDSCYEGSWEKGEKIRFISPGQGGTMAIIIENKPYETLLAEHVAAINADGSEDYDSETARSWIGTKEGYNFTERDGKTILNVQIDTRPEWEQMFNDGWPNALQKLKEICER